jgi:hypothetical protein
MKERIKSFPLGVKVAAVFLLSVYVAMCFMEPILGLALGIVLGTILAIIRVAHYLHFLHFGN